MKMSQSFRHVIRGAQGRVRANFNTPAITSNTRVVNITAAEIKPRIPGITPPFRDQNDPGQNFIFNLGDADVWVSNVSPHLQDHFDGEPGGVEYILHVDFGSPLDVAVTITIDDAFPLSVDNL
jgi:hypothetical protein